MEITVHSNVMGILGTTVISTDPDHTIASVIRAFCNEKGIRHHSGLVLTNCHQEVLQMHRKLSSYEIRNGEELYLSVKESEEWPCGCNQWYILAIVTFLIGALGIAAIAVVKSYDFTPIYTYGIGFDAGSSHTKLFAYQWPVDKWNGTGIVDEIFTCTQYQNRTMQALSSFASNPSAAGEELRYCLDDAKRRLPKQELGGTPVFLGATAGMRLLRQSNSSAAEAIMKSVRDTISTYPFLYTEPNQQVRILEGSEEGTFSWIATNYLSGNFGFLPMTRIRRSAAVHPTVGALDLGGASTQITFVPEDISSIQPGYDQTLMLYGSSHRIYTASYLCYGVNEAYRRYLALLIMGQNYSQTVSDPCGKQGDIIEKTYEDVFQVPCTLAGPEKFNASLKGMKFQFVGKSDSASCKNATGMLFNFSAPCPFSHCSFNGTYQPLVYGRFLAFSGFYYSLAYFKLVPGNFSLSQLVNVTDTYCNNITREVTDKPHCFFAHFIYVLLVDAYGFNETNWNTITFDVKVNGADLGWILGMMINTTNVVPVSMKIEMISMPVFIILNILFAVFMLLSFCFLAHARRDRHRYYEVMTCSEGSESDDGSGGGGMMRRAI